MHKDMDWADALAVVVVAESYRDDELDEATLRNRIAEALRENSGRKAVKDATIASAHFMKGEVRIAATMVDRCEVRRLDIPLDKPPGRFHYFLWHALGLWPFFVCDTSELLGLKFYSGHPAWLSGELIGHHVRRPSQLEAA